MATSTVTEIAPDVYRISIYLERLDMQFNQFLVLDDEPLLFHTGLRCTFSEASAALRRVLDPQRLRWIAFSHFEADECGALAEWRSVAPRSRPACSVVAKLVSVDDAGGGEPARGLADDEVFETGRRRFRFLRTPHVPHCWEAGLLFEETGATLFCSDLLTHRGDVEASTAADVVGRARAALVEDQQGAFADAYPYTPRTDAVLARLAELRPATLALMHGSAFTGDGARALRDWSVVLREVAGGFPVNAAA